MIEQYLKPESISQAMEFKAEYGAKAVYFAGGSKLNATPTKTDKTVAIALTGLGLHNLESCSDGLNIGAMIKLQSLIDSSATPEILKQAAGFIYSRNIRNQATLAGEIATLKDESPLIPALLVLQATLLLGDGKTVALEDYLASARSALIQKVIIPDVHVIAATNKVSRSAAGLNVITAAVSIPAKDKVLIALDGVSKYPIRLHAIENRALAGEALEKAVSALIKPQADIRLIGSYKHTNQSIDGINPHADLRGSVEYKSYIAGVLIADLLSACLEEEAKLCN